MDAGGVPHGMTANSFTSVSLDPLLVLVCVDRRAKIVNQFHLDGNIGINVLHESQVHLSVRFAEPERDRFGSVEWYPGETGVPLIPNVIATLECTVWNMVEAGDHTILIAKVRHAAFREGEPLIFFNSNYYRLRSFHE
jgi:flavin reductase (DIM6/NTAB) family NADH-FMN oxidoreductase RutF